MMASKNKIDELNKGTKLDGNKYDKWYRSMIYILNEQQVTKTLDTIKTGPPINNIDGH